MLTLVGIDPGIVHTGFVVMEFHEDCTLDVHAAVYDGDKVDLVVDTANKFTDAYIFIEAYRPRGNVFAQDKKMAELCSVLNARIRRGKLVDNTGVKQVVSAELMEVFGVWKFAIPSHHQDLRSAARIALYGALKDLDLNQVLFDYAHAKLNL